MKQLSLPGSRGESRSGPQPGRAGSSRQQDPRLGCSQRSTRSCSPAGPLIGFSGKLFSHPKDLYFFTSWSTRALGVKSPTAAPRPPRPQHSGATTGCRSYPGAPVTSWQRLHFPRLRLAQPEGHNYRLGNYLCLYKQGRRPLGSASRATGRQLLTPWTKPKDKARRGGLQTSGPMAPKLKVHKHLHTPPRCFTEHSAEWQRRPCPKLLQGRGGTPSGALVTGEKKKGRKKRKGFLPPPPPQPAYLWQSPVYLVQVSRHPNVFPYWWSGKSPASNAPGHSTSAFFFWTHCMPKGKILPKKKKSQHGVLYLFPHNKKGDVLDECKKKKSANPESPILYIFRAANGGEH